MAYRARVALVAALAAGPVLPASGAAAAECVKVVVDYGTLAGAPSGPRTACVDVPYGGTAAEALTGRARYKGNFLCAIDGYPESGCGDEPPSPYWSIWYWSGGRWNYSQEGVATLEVADRDRDGHPDPFGFRYHEVDKRSAPRADPSYPRPTTRPPTPRPTATRAPSAPASRPATTGGPAAPGASGPAATAPGGPAGPGAAPSGSGSGTASPAAPGAGSGAPSATATGGPAAGGSASPTPEGDDRATGPDHQPGTGDGFPAGTLAGALLAVGLLGATAWRLRRPAA